MAQLRQDPTTWIWIIAGEPAGGTAPAAPAECPFCPTAGDAGEVVIDEKRDATGAWTVRVLADRAPVFRFEGELDRQGDGIYDSMNAVGAHEIVVEGQAHDLTLAGLPPAAFSQVLEACRERLVALKRDSRLRYVELFQNQRQEAGALITHPHAQIIGAPIIPARVERELRAANKHYQLKERCIYCDLLRQEIRDPRRLVELTDDYLLLCPYASRVPYEMWLLPRRHHACFEEAVAAPAALAKLAAAFQSALRRAEAVTPVLNFVLHTEPNRQLPTWLREDWQTLSDDYHWHIELTPRLPQRVKTLPTQEYFLNQALPEEAARHLRTL
ncbi:MAG: galactose-1-phosphate uridylyltransferase [Terriglobia bacterium]